MTLPSDPKNTDADDPLGGLDPLAWLESLAKRQGANPDELTTSANLDVPMPPADTVIDEPGYTPGYDAGKSTAPQSPAPTPVPVQPTPPPIEPSPPPLPETAPVLDASDPFGGLDPMAWLESLAKRQGANPDELMTAADLDVPLPPADTVIDEPGYTPGYDVSKAAAPGSSQPPPPVAAQPPVPAPVEPLPAEPEPVPALDASDPFGGLDPMAWLESLAKRQGANPDELMTAADLDVPMPSADTVIDEPGYTPGYDVGRTAAPEPVQAPVAAQPPITPAAPPEAPSAVTPEPAPAMDDADPFAASDPMAWLESLAKRQGANPEELMTAANLNVPMPPADSVIDEPGYTDYSPFSNPPPSSEPVETPIMSPAEAEALLGITANAPEPNPLNEMDPLAWLESLAAPQATGGSDFSMFASPTLETSEAMEAASALSWLEQLAHEAQSMPPSTPNAEATKAPEAVPAEEQVWADTTLHPAEEAGGMSDDLAQIQQWLAAQAGSLAQVHELDEAPALNTEADVPPAVPGELPDWLRDQMAEASSTPPNNSPLIEELTEPPIPADLPAWLLEESGLSTEDSLSIAFAGNSTEGEMPAAALTSQPEAAPGISPAELEALVTPGVDETPDPWIEAFEFEENRKKAGDESIPDWYMEALQQFGETTGIGQLEPSVTVPSDVLPPGDIPSWLSGLEPESQTDFTSEPELSAMPHAEEAEAIPGDIPAWLLGAMPNELASSGPATPGMGFDSVDLADLPDWLRSAAEAEAPSRPLPSTPAPVPVAEIVPPVTPVSVPPVAVQSQPPPPLPVSQPPVTVAPPPATPATPPVLAPTPIEHTQRLQQARTLVAQQQYRDSLPHYQSLINSEAHLDDVITDMQQIVTVQPADPRPRRLLGDAHLRQGNLQAALDAYRSALDQL